jgi:hypothetical protein
MKVGDLMRIIVASSNDSIIDYLVGAGYQVKCLYSNDLALKVIQEFPCDVVVYFSNVETVISHEEVIAAISGAGIRVVLVAEPDNPLLFYTAALGNVDILLYPVEPENLIHRLENPSTALEIAKLVYNCTQKRTIIEKKDTTVKTEHSNEEEKPVEEQPPSKLSGIINKFRDQGSDKTGPTTKQTGKVIDIRLRKPVRIIGIVSARSCGVTFTTVNLAVMLSRNQKVAIIDPVGDCRMYFFPPGVSIYNTLDEISQENYEYVLIDGREYLQELDRAVVVYSPELYYIEPVKTIDRLISCPRIRVLNRATALPVAPEKLLGVVPDAIVPYIDNLRQIVIGRPAVLDHPEVRKVFVEIENLIVQKDVKPIASEDRIPQF